MGMTSGVLKALQRNRHRSMCSCGFPLPVYPGRYPSKCPSCGEPRVTTTPAPAPTGGEPTED